MLDYAANGPRYWPPGSLRAHFEARCTRDGDEPDEVLQRTFGGELAVEEWWATVDANLRAETDDVAVTRQLLAWADYRDVDVAFGTAMNNPSMKLERQIGDRSLGVVRLSPDGTVEINFGHLAAPFNDLTGWRQLAERLEQIDGLKIPPDRLGKFPRFPSKLLPREEQLARFKETIEWAFGEMERVAADQSANDGLASPDYDRGAHEDAK